MSHARKVLVCCVFSLAALNPLTAGAQDTAQGEWFNLFDQETLFGWTQIGEAPFHVAEGVLTCDSGSGGWLATTSRFTDFELEAKIRLQAETTSGIAVRAGLEGHPGENGGVIIPLSEPANTTPDWRTLQVTVMGSDIKATLDGQPVEPLPSIGGAALRPWGYVGILYHHNHKGKVEVASIKLRPLGLDPLFNGKDLSGWKIVPDHKSVFTVDNGAIRITNGNGQIETEGVYKNFVLQLDIFSNGDHLNSGVFFRGKPDTFWTGYESQVRNEWKEDDRTKPVDYGTGGIYGNQPARKVVSTDREWFKKTIVCDGNHMAVWINGYQVSDFTETRPFSEGWQAKEAYVPQAGTIHLQGHDPTTDLSFRNINIQEMAGN